MKNTNIRPKLPSKAFDMEYATQFRKEMVYLREHGFEYTFFKLNSYGVPVYKYTKTPELFRAIANFYEQQNLEKEFNQLSSVCDVCEEIIKKQNDLGLLISKEE